MRALTSAVAVAIFVGFALPAAAQDLATSIIGMWKMTSWTRKETTSGKISKDFGEQPVGSMIFLKNGHMVSYAFAQGRTIPAAANMTDAERIALFKSMFAYSGTYKVDVSKIIIHVDGCWNELWTGTNQQRVVEIAGNKLSISAPPFKSILDGQEIVVSSTYERVE